MTIDESTQRIINLIKEIESLQYEDRQGVHLDTKKFDLLKKIAILNANSMINTTVEISNAWRNIHKQIGGLGGAIDNLTTAINNIGEENRKSLNKTMWINIFMVIATVLLVVTSYFNYSAVDKNNSLEDRIKTLETQQKHLLQKK